MTGFAGTICKNCSKMYHICHSCGVETFYFDYCSTKCLFEAGFAICDCGGYTEYCEEKEDCSGYRNLKPGEERSKTFDEQMNEMRSSKRVIATKPIRKK